MDLSLFISAFVAGILMFLAPCTLPLVPGYLAFISGLKESKLRSQTHSYNKKVLINALFFSLGFSLVFVSFGVLAGFAGTHLGPFRIAVTRIAGVIIILFGLFMLNIFSLPLLSKMKTVRIPSSLTIGTPRTSLLIGGAFALGWTPCIGPVLASVLLIASTTSTVFYGALLLAFFSLGLSIPFIACAFAYTKISIFIYKYQYLSQATTILGGLFLVLIGTLLLTQQFGITLQFNAPFFNMLQQFY